MISVILTQTASVTDRRTDRQWQGMAMHIALRWPSSRVMKVVRLEEELYVGQSLTSFDWLKAAWKITPAGFFEYHSAGNGSLDPEKSPSRA